MFRLALKNIRFYRWRTLTTFVLTFITTLFFILYVALMDGSHYSMLHNALKIYTGSMQIYHKGYKEEGGNDLLIRNAAQITKALQPLPNISAMAARFETFVLASHAEYSYAMQLTGVDFKSEAALSMLKESRLKGVYASSGACLYLGSELAKKLHVTLQDELSIIGSAVDYSFVAQNVTVCGLFKSGLYDLDAHAAFMNRAYFDSLFNTDNMASYIALMAKELDNNTALATAIKPLLSNELQLYTWEELMHAMVQLMQVDSLFGYLSIALFFIVIFFVIMIFNFLNITARIHEFGTLQSIGVSRFQMTQLLLYELLIITLIAIILATLAGGYLSYYYAVHPIIIEGMDEMYKQYGIVQNSVPTRFNTLTILGNALSILLLNVASLLYPLFYLRRFTPIEAMRHV